MEHNININKVPENNNNPEDYEFRYNFINEPWDYRTRKSKIGIVVLLVSIFVATMACVANNFLWHYRGFQMDKHIIRSVPNCFTSKMAMYRYVAKIHSSSTKELLCVGAVVGPNSILASGICSKSGPIRVYLGSPMIPACKKSFSIDTVDPISYEGEPEKLVRLTSKENIQPCAHKISIGSDINWNSKAHVIGRALSMGRSLFRQTLTVSVEVNSSKRVSANLESMICVEDQPQCPVKVGDLLVQNGHLFGIAEPSGFMLGSNRTACFIDLNTVRSTLKELDPNIGFI